MTLSHFSRKQTRLFRLSCLLCGGLILFLTILMTPIMAQNQGVDQISLVNLSVSPPSAYLRLKPGSSATHTITLENLSNSPLTISPEVVDFKPDGQTGVPQVQKTLSFPYLDIPESGLGTLTLEPKQTAQLTLKFKAPAGSQVKEYPMTILFHHQNNDLTVTSGNSQAQISASIGSNLVVLVADRDLEPQLKVKSIQAPLITDTFQVFEFSPLLENGQVSATIASGSASIKNWQGRVAVNWQIFPDVVLGQSTRQAQALIDILGDSPRPGTFKLKSKLWGIHSIQVSTTHQNPEGAMVIDSTQSRYFLAIPIIPSLILILLGILAVYIKFIKR